MKDLMLAAALILGLTVPAWARLDVDSTLLQRKEAAAFEEGLQLGPWDEGRPGPSRLQRAVAAYDRGGFAEALRTFRPLAERGNVVAQNNLGAMYEHGHGIRQDQAAAVVWYRRAAEQGYALAQTNLGAMYDHGKGVRKDHSVAAHWWRKAAEQGEPHAQYNLGGLYAGGRGVAQDYAEAARWWRKAAEQGNRIAQYNLGTLYAQGRGVARDDGAAANWYRKAAEQGYGLAQTNLSFLYANGRAVPRDFVQAYMWVSLALSRLPPGPSRDRASRNRELFAKRMTPAEITRAELMASQWSSGIKDPQGAQRHQINLRK